MGTQSGRVPAALNNGSSLAPRHQDDIHALNLIGLRGSWRRAGFNYLQLQTQAPIDQRGSRHAKGMQIQTSIAFAIGCD
jgi:hypothetical protein